MVPKVFRKSHFEFMSHILNLVTEIAETNQAKAIDAKFAKHVKTVKTDYF